MVDLLVSVRDAAEAVEALRGGASIIDVKEPLRGPLGAAEPVHWHGVLRVAGGRVPVSAALGELTDDAMSHRLSQLPPLAFAKIGLAGCRRCATWPAQWASALGQLPPGVAAVAVVYADWRRAEAPAPDEVVRRGIALGCRAVLFDTFDKRSGWLLDHLSATALRPLIRQVRLAGRTVVLAGSVTRSRWDELWPLAADVIAVRGAVCDGRRTDRVRQQRVRDLVDLISCPGRRTAACLPDERSQEEPHPSGPLA